MWKLRNLIRKTNISNKFIKEMLNPKNLIDYNISSISGCSEIVIILASYKISISNVGN